MATSLSLQNEELAEEIRETEGKNNAERLKNWAENYSGDDSSEEWTESEIKDLAEEKFWELQRSM